MGQQKIQCLQQWQKSKSCQSLQQELGTTFEIMALIGVKASTFNGHAKIKS